jgi:hypothetical protein
MPEETLELSGEILLCMLTGVRLHLMQCDAAIDKRRFIWAGEPTGTRLPPNEMVEMLAL